MFICVHVCVRAQRRETAGAHARVSLRVAFGRLFVWSVVWLVVRLRAFVRVWLFVCVGWVAAWLMYVCVCLFGSLCLFVCLCLFVWMGFPFAQAKPTTSKPGGGRAQRRRKGE